MQLCEFLFAELHSRGVRQIFGIPGDYVLNLYEALEKIRKVSTRDVQPRACGRFRR